MLSVHGCYQHHKKAGGDKVGNVDGDAEQGIYVSNNQKSLGPPVEHLARQPAGLWGYIFQIIFQVHFSFLIREFQNGILVPMYGLILSTFSSYLTL